MQEILRVLFTASLSFIALFITAKVMGKKQISQLDFVDYAVGISIGSIAAQMAIDPEIPFYHFLIAMAIYVIIDLLLNLISRKFVKLKAFIKGKPLILIENGKLNYENLKNSKLDLNELLSLCREKNHFNIFEIAYCIFETNGKLSIMPKGAFSPPKMQNLNLQADKPELSKDVIMNGKIIEKALKEIKKDKEWLFKKLNLKNENEINNIVLAAYDKKTDEINKFYC